MHNSALKENLANSLAKNNYNLEKLSTFKQKYYHKLSKRYIIEFFFSLLLIESGHHLTLAANYQLVLWPSIAVALAGIFLRGNSIIAPLAVGVFAVSIFYHSIWQAILLSLIITSQVWLTRFLSLKLIGAVVPLPSLSVFLKWFAIVVINQLISFYLIMQMLPSLEWYNVLAPLNAILGLAPIALMLDPFSFESDFKSRKWLVLATIILVLNTLFILGQFSNTTLILANLILVAIFAIKYTRVQLGLFLLGLSAIYLAIGVIPHKVFYYNIILFITLMWGYVISFLRK